MAIIKELRGFTPQIGENCFIAETAAVIGDVTMGDNCYVMQDKGKGVMFYNASGMEITIPYNRCYLTLPANSNSGAYRLYRGATGVECIKDIAEGDSATEIYDITGRKVTNMTPGNVYIVNGKKVYIKK